MASVLFLSTCGNGPGTAGGGGCSDGGKFSSNHKRYRACNFVHKKNTLSRLSLRGATQTAVNRARPWFHRTITNVPFRKTEIIIEKNM